MLVAFVMGLYLMVSPIAANAILGTVKGYVDPATRNVKVGDKFSAKIVLDSGSNKLSVVSLNLNIDTSKVKVNSVTMNKAVFTGVFMEKEAGGVISLYGTSSVTTANLPKGVVEVGTIDLEAVAVGTISMTLKNFEITGPSSSNDYSYGLDWQNGSVVVGSATIIPTATPIPGNGTDGVLKFRIAFAGVMAGSQCSSNWPVDVMVKESSGNTKQYSNISLTADGTFNNLSVYRGQVLLTGIVTKSSLAVFIKGPKHLQVKYANNGQEAFYNQAGGNISVDVNANNTTTYDFTKYPVLAGDINRDGSVDGLDFSVVKAEVNKRTEGDSLSADLNGNCKLESQDLSLLMLAMKDKQEQLY